MHYNSSLATRNKRPVHKVWLAAWLRFDKHAAQSSCLRQKPRLCALGLLLLLIGCAASPLPNAPTIVPPPTIERRLVGLVDEASALTEIVQFSPAQLEWHFESGDGQALVDGVLQGDFDAALVHHIPLSAEALWHNPVALDGLVLIVHPSNPVTNLSLAQVQAIYAGEITNWQALGGADANIDPLLRGRDSGVREIFEARVMGAQRVSVNTEIRPTGKAMLNAVANQPNAIGLSAYSRLTPTVQALALNQIAADTSELATQRYPLTTPLYWVSAAEPVGEIRGLLAYLQSEAGQAALGQKFGRVR